MAPYIITEPGAFEKGDKMMSISSNLILYGVAHGIVDAVCAGVFFSLLREKALTDLAA